jgi:hypothetical protein
VQTWNGVASGSFSAPDHEYPSHLELQLTAIDSGGTSATTSVAVQPKTVDLTFASAPSGLSLTVGSASGTAPFTRTVIVNSLNSISAPSPQTLNGTTYTFSSWSDGRPAAHDITAPASPATYTATYAVGGSGGGSGTPPANSSPPVISGSARRGATLQTSNGSWTGTTPIGFTYQWLRCSWVGASCTPIAGASAPAYTVTAADVGFRLRVVVTAASDGGVASAASTLTDVVAAVEAAPPPPLPPPPIRR